MTTVRLLRLVLIATVGALMILGACGDATKVGRVSVEQVEEMIGQEGCIVVDTRESGLFVAGHIPKAVSVHFDEIPRWASRVPSRTRVVLYCD